jgi:hypothetical protein
VGRDETNPTSQYGRVVEITRRVKADPVFQVQTIHSFAWSLIEGRTADIRGWLKSNLQKDIAEIQAADEKGRAGKGHDERVKKMTSKTKRLERLAEIRAFTYSPVGDNFGRDALQHTEVIELAAHFLIESETFQNIVLARYPFILIDESQDTMKTLMEAFLTFEARHRGRIALGLLGDTMQRIYTDGLRDLAQRVCKALCQLKGSVGRVRRDLHRHLQEIPQGPLREKILEALCLVGYLLEQGPKSKNKISSLHEPEVDGISKGKARVRYEFGTKVSLATTLDGGFIVGARSFAGNPYDGHTLAPALEQVDILTDMRPSLAVVDRG